MGRISRSMLCRERNACSTWDKTFVGADRIPGSDRLFGQAGTDNVKTVEPGFGGDLVLFAAGGEAGVLDAELEVLGHLMLADDRAHCDADFVLSVQRIALVVHQPP